jgi:hypothetical protein
MNASQAIVSRTSTKDIKMRDLYVQVDDLPEETLLFGDTLDIDLTPGDHHIKVTNRVYSKTVNFNLKEGESVRFTGACVSSRSIISVLMMMVGTVPYKVDIWKN